MTWSLPLTVNTPRARQPARPRPSPSWTAATPAAWATLPRLTRPAPPAREGSRRSPPSCSRGQRKGPRARGRAASSRPILGGDGRDVPLRRAPRRWPDSTYPPKRPDLLAISFIGRNEERLQLVPSQIQIKQIVSYKDFPRTLRLLQREQMFGEMFWNVGPVT